MSFGSAIANECAFAALRMVAVLVAVAALIALAGGILIGRYIAPPPAAVKEMQAERQAIVEKLTPREREVLGVQ